MTSGKFQTISIDQITISRDERQRRELVGIEELAESIRVTGLINPPVVDQNLVLVAGERRLTACKLLGWTAIPVQFAEELPRDQLYLIELEENVKRVDLDWKDQVAAIEQYHKLRSAQEAEWNTAQSARALGISPKEIYSKLAVAEALREGDPLVVNADKYSVARGVVERKTARAKSAEIDMLKAKAFSPKAAKSPSQTVEAVVDIDEEIAEELVVETPFLHADFTEWASSYAGPRFNFLHCDFPYGVNAGSHNQGAADAFGGYDDSADVYWSLLDTLADCMGNVVAESAHMMFWFSMDYYHETKTRLESMGWVVNPFPLIWHKSDNSGILPDPKRGPRRIYETAFLCTRGDRFVIQAVANTFAAPNLKEIHMSEKNKEMLSHFFRMFVDASTIMLDPTAGSGNAVVVAEKMGAPHRLGLERDQEFFSRAVETYISGLTSDGVEV
jgi:ParB family chromosome partitioning protein